MTRIPRAALVLTAAGALPFLWAAATHLSPSLAAVTGGLVPPDFMGKYAGLTYGRVILSFMSGVLWGFAARTTGRRAAIGYALSVIPALWVVFAVSGAGDAAILNLMAGFAAVLVLDAGFAWQGAAPAWWMTLRLPITGLVLACLACLLYG